MDKDCKCNKVNTLGLNHLRGTKLLSPKCNKPGIFFTTEVIPSNMGTSEAGQPFAPKNGAFFNTLVIYQADGGRFLYDSEGNYTELTGATTEEIRAIVADLATDEELETAVRALEQQIDAIKNSPDVVDIVATHADLVAYDTTNLGDNDIIRVLADETHDGDSTYYRWDKTTSQWIYIGAIPVAANTIFYSDSSETGQYRHIYKDAAFTTLASAQDILDANEVGQVILRLTTYPNPNGFSDGYLQNTYVGTGDYQFLFLDENSYREYAATTTADTQFYYTDTQVQFKLTFDSTPTAGSSNPVTSAGIKTYVDGAAPVITMSTTDPGEGSPLAANHFVGVYS